MHVWEMPMRMRQKSDSDAKTSVKFQSAAAAAAAAAAAPSSSSIEQGSLYCITSKSLSAKPKIVAENNTPPQIRPLIGCDL